MTNTKKPLIHFAHANGIPSKCYRVLFEALSDDYDIVAIPQLGTDPSYPVDNHWQSLTQQVLDSVKSHLKATGHNKVIGLGHSLGSLCTLQAAYREPHLFSQVICLDPPIIHGSASMILHWAKNFSPTKLDEITPASLSVKRRDVWDSREQAYDSLREKPFYANFDERCFQDYINYALTDTPEGKVTLTIPKVVEVAVFRTNPSLYWLKPNHPPAIPAKIVVGKASRFLARGFPEMIQQRMGIPYETHEGGHMFPLEYPDSTVATVKKIIEQQTKQQR